ncbi:zinc metalloprotease [Kribbella sp. NBC_01505]|uniref:zinc metalloprotease n=1 Tax=Kribbella sp. NBC_01505 TaxID=2903580 RepID=UPI00386490BE
MLKARQFVFAAALVGSALVAPVASATTPVDCLTPQQAHTDRPRDLIGGQRAAQDDVLPDGSRAPQILRDAYASGALPRRLLTKDPDGTVHAKVGKGQARIQVYVHVVHDGATGKVSPTDVVKQLQALNRNFAATSANMFAFTLVGLDYTDNKTWHTVHTSDEGPTLPDEAAMKTALHKGGPGDLNLYLNEPQYQDPNDGSLSGLIGIATFPWTRADDPVRDGVMIKYTTLPGGASTHFNEGKQALHETGHWLGLYHVFQNGCTTQGDYVADTPAEASPTDGCPTGKLACDGSSLAPVHNFMDYSDDACLSEFTPQQAQRAADNWLAYRYARRS